MIILYPILIFLSKTVNGKFSLLQMFPPPKFSSPSLVLHNLRFLTPNFFSPAFFSHPTSSFPKISPDFSSSKSFSSPKVPPSEKALSPQIPFPKTFLPIIPFLSANRVSFLLSSSPAFPAPPFSLFRQTKSRRFSPTAFLLSAFLLTRLTQPAAAQPRGFRFQHFQPVRQPLRARPEFPCRSARQPVSGYAARYRYRPESNGRR